MRTSVELKPPEGWHEIHAGPIFNLKHLALFVLLPDGALWQCSIPKVLMDQVEYYEENGWDEDLPDDQQPKRKELIGLIIANCDWVDAAKECHWRRLSGTASHVSGPETEPPYDLLWAVDEMGGDIAVYTDIPQAEQYKLPHYWRDVQEIPENV